MANILNRRILHLTTFADRSAWISDDRVNALISARTGGIEEIGYHGKQPVSRNSRIFRGVEDEGVLSFFVQDAMESWTPVSFEDIRWYPAGARCVHKLPEGSLLIDIEALQRSITIGIEIHSTAPARFRIRFNLNALLSDVRGTRTWSSPRKKENSLFLSFRDLILSNEWLRKTGPYAGDFLIPEPMRRKLFTRRCRSGLATLEDVRPELRDEPIPIYDAEVFCRLGGDGFTLEVNGTTAFFEATLQKGKQPAQFIVQFGDAPEQVKSGLPQDANLIRNRQRYDTVRSGSPVLGMEAYQHVREFVSTVPGLVESCKVADYGMTRACPGAYYFIWAWDNLVTAREMSRWGDFEGMQRIADFINHHRDIDGSIPGRWTRSLEPLDTPPKGGLEFLHTLLTLDYAVQSDDRKVLREVYPFALRHFNEVEAKLDGRGNFANIGFYPDLPSQFGRTEQSAVAMEVAAFYSYSRTLECISLSLEDAEVATRCGKIAEKIQSGFLQTFWDREKHFLIDSIDIRTGEKNRTFPMFSLLFLQTPPGRRLLRGKEEQAAAFIEQSMLTEYGFRMVPAWDSRRASEPVMNSWYPHWDIYPLMLFRRSGRVDAILRWLKGVEETLEALGYCPEFLSLEGFEADHPDRWLKHGSVSNLNCVTGWYRSILEGIIGLEFDTGGITIVPLALPLGTVRFSGLKDRRTTFDIAIVNGGPHLHDIRLDGSPLRGCLKLPATVYDGGQHTIEITYGDQPASGMCFSELVNAEVLSVSAQADRVEIEVNGFGLCDIAFDCPNGVRFSIDGKDQSYEWDEQKKRGRVQQRIVGKHTLSIKMSTKFTK